MSLQIAQGLPIHFPLKPFYSEIAFYAMHFVLSYTTDIVSTFPYA